MMNTYIIVQHTRYNRITMASEMVIPGASFNPLTDMKYTKPKVNSVGGRSVGIVNAKQIWLMNQQFRKNSLNRCCAVKLSRWHRTKFVMAGLWRVFSKTTQAFSQLFDKPRVGSRSK